MAKYDLDENAMDSLAYTAAFEGNVYGLGRIFEAGFRPSEGLMRKILRKHDYDWRWHRTGGNGDGIRAMIVQFARTAPNAEKILTAYIAEFKQSADHYGQRLKEWDDRADQIRPRYQGISGQREYDAITQQRFGDKLFYQNLVHVLECAVREDVPARPDTKSAAAPKAGAPVQQMTV